MLKKFLMKKMLKSQMKGVSEEQQEQIIGMFEKDPELFKKIAEEIQVEMKNGKDQMTASMAVMRKYQDQLKGLM
tara:strand:+ start:187 stop:408 length:222 start_codon:yes stop_codon:yes gene_type:complete